MNYPFNEGEKYFTIEEENYIVESCWDCQSEELHSPDKLYFATFNEAYHYYRFIRTDEMLHNAVKFIQENLPSDASDEFMLGFAHFNVEPKLFLI